MAKIPPLLGGKLHRRNGIERAQGGNTEQCNRQFGGEAAKMNKVEICGVNTAKLPVLPNKKMRVLLARIQAGDKDARDEMVQGEPAFSAQRNSAL